MDFTKRIEDEMNDDAERGTPPKRAIAFNMGSSGRQGGAYAKADLTKIARFGSNVAISFFQVDYQEVAEHMQTPQQDETKALDTIPVSRVVLDMDGFRLFTQEIAAFIELLRRQGLDVGGTGANAGLIRREAK